MQSFEIKKSTLYQLGIAAVVLIWVLATGFASTIMMSSAAASSSDTGHVAIEAPRHNKTPAMFDAGDTTGFLEWHTDPPTSSEMGVKRPQLNVTPAGALDLKVLSYEQMRFLEINAAVASVPKPNVLSYDEMRFLEMNVLVSGVQQPAVLTTEEMRFLEMNVLLPEGGAADEAKPSVNRHPIGAFDY